MLLVWGLAAPDDAAAYVGLNPLQEKGLNQYLAKAPELSSSPPTSASPSCNATCVRYVNAAKGLIPNGAEPAATPQGLANATARIRMASGMMRPLGYFGAAAGAFWVGWQIGTQIRVWTRHQQNVAGSWIFTGPSPDPLFYTDLGFQPPFWWQYNSSGVWPTGAQFWVHPWWGTYYLNVAATVGLIEGPYPPNNVPVHPGDRVPTPQELADWPTTTTNIPSEEQLEEEDPCAKPITEHQEDYCVGIAWPVHTDPEPNENGQPEPGDGWEADPHTDRFPDTGPQKSPNGDPTTNGDPGEGDDAGTPGADPSCAKWVKPRIDLDPLNLPIWNVFPFGVPIFLYGVVTMFDGAGTAPAWTIPIGNGDLSLDLSVANGFMSVFRAVLGLLFFVSSGTMVARWAFGSPGDD